MFWKVWRAITLLLFVAFVVICFADNCSFIYHTDTTSSFIIQTELTLLVLALMAAIVDIFFGE